MEQMLDEDEKESNSVQTLHPVGTSKREERREVNDCKCRYVMFTDRWINALQNIPRRVNINIAQLSQRE